MDKVQRYEQSQINAQDIHTVDVARHSNLKKALILLATTMGFGIAAITEGGTALPIIALIVGIGLGGGAMVYLDSAQSTGVEIKKDKVTSVNI